VEIRKTVFVLATGRVIPIDLDRAKRKLAIRLNDKDRGGLAGAANVLQCFICEVTGLASGAHIFANFYIRPILRLGQQSHFDQHSTPGTTTLGEPSIANNLGRDECCPTISPEERFAVNSASSTVNGTNKNSQEHEPSLVPEPPRRTPEQSKQAARSTTLRRID
jgi:hypothetical protein